MTKKQTNFEAGEKFLNKLKDQGFKIKPNEVRKNAPKGDYTIMNNGKPILNILPRAKCHFKYIDILSSGKLVTVGNKKEIDALFTSLLEFKDEISK